MADEKKSLLRNDAIFIYAALKHQVNDRKSKQECQNKNLQNPLGTNVRAKNKRGARKYTLRENTLPTLLNIILRNSQG